MDGVAALLLGAGTFVLFTGGGRVDLFGASLSIHSPARIYVWGLVLLLLRHLWIRERSPVTALQSQIAASAPSDDVWLFAGRDTGARRRRIVRVLLATAGFAALTAIATWPQIRSMDSVPDLGDPLFSIWRLGWVNHQLASDPRALFDANIFHPERLTYAYSDSMLVPALAGAPLLRAGIHPVTVYNTLFLAGFALSGVAMFALVRALVGRNDAAAIAGAIFALYPFRYEHYSHLELQMTMWMPLTAWALHRTLARGRVRDGLAAGAAFALQALSSLYHAAFFAVYLVPIVAVLWRVKRRGARPLPALVAGGAMAAAIVAPVAIMHARASAIVGERNVRTVSEYSAVGPDYLRPHWRSAMHGVRAAGGHAERQLFPGIVPVAMGALALWPPISAPVLAYSVGLCLAVDMSLGLNGISFPVLREYVPGFASIRVPARASLLAGFTLALLSGYAARRLVRRWPAYRWPITAVVIGAVAAEVWPLHRLEKVWETPPDIYHAVEHDPAAVLAEFPMAARIEDFPIDPRYQYFSTVHWRKMVNGNSGFLPASYGELLWRMRQFPSDAAIAYLRARGVTHITVHGAFLPFEEYRSIVGALDRHGDLRLVAAMQWEGSESRLYRFSPR